MTPELTPLTPTQAEQGRAEWKTAVAMRANSMIRANNAADRIEKLTAKIKTICLEHGAEIEAECLNTETVAAWLSDAQMHVPANRELHDALMEALALPTAQSLKPKPDTRRNWHKRFAPLEKLNPVQARLAQTRERLETAWAQAFGDECKQFVEASADSAASGHGKAGRNRGAHHTMPQRPDGNYDSRFLPERTGDIHTTKNIHEYLSLLRDQLEESHAGMAELLDISETTYGEWECGASIPGRDSLITLKNKLNGKYEDLVNVLIDNRLAILRGVLREHTDSWGVASERYKNIASNILTAMPHRYWQEVLDQAHASMATTAKPRAQKPEWASHVVEVKTQGEYLAAVRHYLGLSSDEVAAAIGIDPAPILKFEAGTTSVHSESAKRCIEFYTREQEKILEGKIRNGMADAAHDARFFSPEILAKLPQHDHASEVHGIHTERVRQGSEAGAKGWSSPG